MLEAIRTVQGALDLNGALEAVLDGAARIAEYDAAAIYLLDSASRLQRSIIRGAPTVPAGIDRPRDAVGAVERAVVTARGQLVDQLDAQQAGAGDERQARALIVPIVGRHQLVIGLLTLESAAARYTPECESALSIFASGVAASIEALLPDQLIEKRRVESELMVARRVMHDLLPHGAPSLGGLEIAALNQPSYEVGGDYYEFIPLGDDRWGIAIADVVGKGVAAALLVAAMRASLSSLAGHELALRAIMRRANRFFHDSVAEGRYVTLFYAVMDVPARRLIYVNAGHLPPIVARNSGRLEFLEEGGFPLGLFEEPRYYEGFLTLQDGDVLALYTDGITDAMDAEEDLFGRERLADVVLRNRHARAAAISTAVFEEVRRFSGGRVADDETLVVLKAIPRGRRS